MIHETLYPLYISQDEGSGEGTSPEGGEETPAKEGGEETPAEGGEETPAKEGGDGEGETPPVE